MYQRAEEKKIRVHLNVRSMYMYMFVEEYVK